MYHTQKKLTVFLLFSLFKLFQSEFIHQCIHDQKSINITELNAYDEEEYINPKNHNRFLQNQQPTWQPLRITFDFSSLESSLSKDQMYFLENTGKIAQKFFSDNLRVERIQGNNIFRKNQRRCGQVKVPQQDKDTGIENSDIHLYITSQLSFQLFVAQAQPCLLNDLEDNDNVELYIETFIHEITHILGFSSFLFDFWINPNTQKPYFKTGDSPILKEESIIYLTSKNVKEFAQQYYNCTYLKGMPLESSGGQGRVGSHWLKRVIENENMVGTIISHDAIFSNFTFKLLEDTGWYKPTYKHIDKSVWGKNKGCDFLTNCQPSKYREFNFGREREYSCNFYHNSATFSGQNSENSCVTPFQFRECIDNSYVSRIDIRYTGEKYGFDSRCFESDLRIIENNNNNVYTQQEYDFLLRNLRCLQYKCDSQGNIYIIINEQSYKIDKLSNKINITLEGSNKNITGVVKGPEDWEEFCFEYPQPCKHFCSKNGYCLNNTCHCLKDYGGEDCSIYCPILEDKEDNNTYVIDGECFEIETCPKGYILKEETRECILFPDIE